MPPVAGDSHFMLCRLCTVHALTEMESLVHAVMYQVGLGTVLEVVDAETLPANVDLLQTPQKLYL